MPARRRPTPSDVPTHGAEGTLSGVRLLAVTEEELQRLVLDVHDGPVQYLFAALGHLTALRDRAATDPALAASAASISRSVQCVESALADIRRTITALRAPEFAEVGLAGALQDLVVGHEARTGADVALTIEGELPTLPLAATIALYRIVQEGLSNVERHAGVKAARVRTWATRTHVCVEVSDKGQGFTPPTLMGPHGTDLPAHIGMRGMRERAALVHGTVSVQSHPGGGTRVRAEVPVPHA